MAVALVVAGVDGATSISACTDGVPSSATVMVPEKVSNLPRTLLTMRCLTEKPTVEWTGSMVQVPAGWGFDGHCGVSPWRVVNRDNRIGNNPIGEARIFTSGTAAFTYSKRTLVRFNSRL